MQSGELFSLTYGALVAQLVKDYEIDSEINKQLDQMYVAIIIIIMSHKLSSTCRLITISFDFAHFLLSFLRGYSIGIRLIEDFLARFPDIGKCHDLKTTADILAKV